MSITFCCLVADGGWVWCWPLRWVQRYRQGRFTIGPVRAKAAITQLTFCLHQAGVSCVFAMLKTQAVAVDYASVFLNLKIGFWCTLLLDIFLSFICILVWKWEEKMYKLVLLDTGSLQFSHLYYCVFETGISVSPVSGHFISPSFLLE